MPPLLLPLPTTLDMRDSMRFQVLEDMIQGLDHRVYNLEEQISSVGLTLQEILGILMGQEIVKAMIKETKKKENEE